MTNVSQMSGNLILVKSQWGFRNYSWLKTSRVNLKDVTCSLKDVDKLPSCNNLVEHALSPMSWALIQSFTKVFLSSLRCWFMSSSYPPCMSLKNVGMMMMNLLHWHVSSLQFERWFIGGVFIITENSARWSANVNCAVCWHENMSLASLSNRKSRFFYQI